MQLVTHRLRVDLDSKFEQLETTQPGLASLSVDLQCCTPPSRDERRRCLAELREILERVEVVVSDECYYRISRG